MAAELAKPPPITGMMIPTGLVVDQESPRATRATVPGTPLSVSPRGSVPRTCRIIAYLLLAILVILAAAILVFVLNNNINIDTGGSPSSGAAGTSSNTSTSTGGGSEAPADPVPASGSDSGGSSSGDDEGSQSNVWEALQLLRLQELTRDTATVNASIALGTPQATAEADRVRVDADMARYSGEVSYPNMDSQPVMPYTNVGYAALGYDLLAGFPFPADGSVDPGFRRRIFDVTYRNRNVSSSGRLIPDGFEVVESPSADFSFSYHMMSSASDLKSLTDTAWSIKADISVLGIGGASFSHNQEHQTTSDNARNQDSMSSVTVATVKAYRATVVTPSLTPGFKASMLAALSGGEAALTLLKQYGTHYVAEVQMGGRSTQTVTVSTTTMSTANSDATTSSWEAGANGMFEDISGGVSGSQSSKTARDMRNMAGSKDASFSATFTGGVASLGEVDISGGGGGSGGDDSDDSDDGDDGEDSINMESMATWASSVPSHPVPIHYTLSLITDLLTSDNFPDQSSSDLAAIRRSLDTTLLEYCGAACAEEQDGGADEVGLVRYGDLVTITSSAGDLGEGLDGSVPRECWSYSPSWDASKECTIFDCGWANDNGGVSTDSFTCDDGKRPIFLAVTQGGSLNKDTCTLTGASSDPAIMTLLQRNWDSVEIGFRQHRACTGFWCTNGHDDKTWEIAGSSIAASSDTINVVYACMDGANSTKRLLSPIPFKNLARRPVLGGESVIIAMPHGAIVPATGSDCGTTKLAAFSDLDLSDPDSCQFTISGVPVGMPFTTGTTVRFGSNIASSSTSGCSWSMWAAKMPALLMDTPSPVATSSTESSVLQTWLVPTNVEAIVGASNDPDSDNLGQAQALVNAAKSAGDSDGSTFMVFDWTVVSESTETTAQELGYSSAPISFEFAHNVVPTSTDTAVSLFGDIVESQSYKLGQLVDITVEFSEGVYLPYSRNNQYVSTANGPQPALLASDFKITLTNQTDGCKSAAAGTEANWTATKYTALDATAVWFEQDGRQPDTYSLKAEFEPYHLLWPRCLLVTVPSKTQEASGRRISDDSRSQLQPFELTPAALTWQNGTTPTIKIANITFIDAVLNADLAPPQTYDFVASQNNEAVRVVDVVYINPPGGYNATLGVINMLMALEVAPPGAGDGSDITLVIGQKRLRTASSPAVWLSPQQEWLSSPNDLAA